MPCVIECQTIDLYLLLLSAAHSGNLHLCFKSAGNIKKLVSVRRQFFRYENSIHTYIFLLLTIFIQKLNMNFPFEIVWSGLKNRLWTTLSNTNLLFSI